MTTPPPPGQNPFGQGQQPYAPPQGQAPYPPQGGYPQHPAYAPQPGQPGQPGFPPQGAGPYAPPVAPKRKISFKVIRTIVVVVIALGVAIGGYIANRDDADTAKVGDCMHRGSSSATNPDLEVVDCGSSKAQYKVVQKKSGTSASCDRTKYSEYTESKDSNSFTLCLEDYSSSK
ncbi:hypothetical protein [Streptomyces sp. NPDC005423]|uniref:LppU/SCO3897 family protein n=1 Tax=Streptomyces sp. NPDC005423 TaxID=3155343 RepID=UPI0033B10A35